MKVLHMNSKVRKKESSFYEHYLDLLFATSKRLSSKIALLICNNYATFNITKYLLIF